MFGPLKNPLVILALILRDILVIGFLKDVDLLPSIVNVFTCLYILSICNNTEAIILPFSSHLWFIVVFCNHNNLLFYI